MALSGGSLEVMLLGIDELALTVGLVVQPLSSVPLILRLSWDEDPLIFMNCFGVGLVGVGVRGNLLTDIVIEVGFDRAELLFFRLC